MSTTTTLDYQHGISEKKGIEIEVKESSASIFSENSTTTTLFDGSSFHPGSTLHVVTRGIGFWRFPLPSSELETSIYHNDGTLAYTSLREKKCSGSCVLSHAKLGELISTTYFFGPNREPIIRLLQGVGGVEDEANTINIKGRWTSRATAFTLADGRVFEWSYAQTKDANKKKVNLIVLRETDQVGGKAKKDGKILAQLIRSEDTRTPCTSACTAGNGGQLLLDQDSASSLDEAIIVATCLMMLKKEIDRRRAVQIAILTGAASGGS